MLQLFTKAPDKPRWTQGVLFDDSVRDALLPSSQAARARAATLRDVGFFGLPAFLLLADAGLMTWIVQGRADGALQLALVDLEALAITSILTTVAQRSVGRVRPFLLACASEPNRPECSSSSNERNTAFLSGHASIAFATASLLCVEHSRFELYGKADFVICPLPLAAATGTGVLRIVSDKHWATDVLAGAALGSAVGTIVALSHFRTGAAPAALRLTAFVDRNTAGIVYRGEY